MKTKYIIITVVLTLLGKAYAQNPTNSQNFVVETLVKTPGKFLPENLAGLSVEQANRTVRYFDGLGRPLQNVQWQASPAKNDLVEIKEYDIFGREAKKHLPYADLTSQDASYKVFGTSNQASFYASPPMGIKDTSNPYNLTIFEPSPLNRAIEQGAAGSDWQPVPNSTTGHTTKTEYRTNLATEVLLWNINSTNNGALASTYYATGKLYKTINKDENWVSGKIGTAEEFKDLEGRVILKRIWELEDKALDTYYIYDDIGNLRYVLPPAVNQFGQSPISSFDETLEIFNQFIYGYHYDGKKRLIEKKVPGKGWEYLVYNKLNQVTHSQDANQRTQNQWSWTKYDVLGRVILTGIENNQGIDRAGMQAYNDGITYQWEERSTATPEGYTERTHPATGESNANIQFHTVNYYDDYTFPANNSTYSPNGGVSVQTKGLPTANLVRILGTNAKQLTLMYYDEEGRIIEVVADNHLGGLDRTINTYSFVGELTESARSHFANGITTLIATRYEYDHNGRKTKTWQRIGDANSEEVLLSELAYNEIGQLTGKNYHDGIKTTGYTYNERGWLTKSSTPDFEFELKYNTALTPMYNGNIAEQFWGLPGNLDKSYTYSYDKLNRLTSGISNTGHHEKDITYDVMGNLNTLTRDLGTPQSYSYNGNRLSNVSGGASRNYSYDANGNATSDGTNGFTYNILNLISTVTGPNATTYTYDARGKKLSRTTAGITTDYIAGIQYTNGSIDFISTEEGLARRNTNTEYLYQYNLEDHLGNSRYTFNGNGSKIQSDDYYPFGKTFNSFVSGAKNNYLYNGKELQEGLAQYDYGARFYDPVIGRWNVVDPLGEKYVSINPYNYTANNPILFVDKEGKDIIIGNNTAGALLNLAKIVATSKGQEVVDRLIDSEQRYTANAVLFTRNSQYDENSNTINYVGNTWYSSIDGGSAKNELIMGHEIYHGFQDDTFQIPNQNRIGLERGAVSFENYLRDVYGDNQKREQYSNVKGGKKGEFLPGKWNLDNEKVSGFKELGNNEKKNAFGFSYNKRSDKKSKQSFYLILSVDADKKLNYQIYNSKKEYEEAIKNW